MRLHRLLKQFTLCCALLLTFLSTAFSLGCGLSLERWSDKEVLASSSKSFDQERKAHKTVIVREEERAGPPDQPFDSHYQLIKYKSAVGDLSAYLAQPDNVDLSGSTKLPAIVWITGGDCNSIGDVWSPMSRENDQRAIAFRNAGIVMMYPSLRGGNMNPGKREGHFGEVDDILAATDHLASLPYVDTNRIYLGGHSTGGTLVMLVAAATDRYQAVFSFGPVASIDEYGGDFMYCDPKSKEEIMLRSPIFWMHDVRKPLFVLEGGSQGNWSAISRMVRLNKNSQIQFIKVAGHDHFSILAPATEKLAQGIKQGNVNFKAEDFTGLR